MCVHKYCLTKLSHEKKKKITQLENNTQHNEDSDKNTELVNGTVHINIVDQYKNDWIETLTINDHNAEFKLDTGVLANIITEHVFDKLHKLHLNNQQLTNTKVRFVTWCNLPHNTKILCVAVSMTYHLSGCEYSSNSWEKCMNRDWIHCARTLYKQRLIEEEFIKNVNSGKHHINIENIVTSSYINHRKSLKHSVTNWKHNYKEYEQLGVTRSKLNQLI